MSLEATSATEIALDDEAVASGALLTSGILEAVGTPLTSGTPVAAEATLALAPSSFTDDAPALPWKSAVLDGTALGVPWATPADWPTRSAAAAWGSAS